ncbi:MAG: rhodanese-like domain-containing protein [Desulfovermiculus sp.]|nr:rhodanese-like domain-containing protein [Desulfovermiculus sp.]
MLYLILAKGGSMRMRLYHLVLAGLVIWLGACVATQKNDLQSAEEDGVPRMSIHQLKDIMGKKDLVILDTRLFNQWKASQKKIPGAEHHSSFEASEWAEEYDKESTIVLYCA